jgi:hypothetical protein
MHGVWLRKGDEKFRMLERDMRVLHFKISHNKLKYIFKILRKKLWLQYTREAPTQGGFENGGLMVVTQLSCRTFLSVLGIELRASLMIRSTLPLSYTPHPQIA